MPSSFVCLNRGDIGIRIHDDQLTPSGPSVCISLLPTPFQTQPVPIQGSAMCSRRRDTERILAELEALSILERCFQPCGSSRRSSSSPPPVPSESGASSGGTSTAESPSGGFHAIAPVRQTNMIHEYLFMIITRVGLLTITIPLMRAEPQPPCPNRAAAAALGGRLCRERR